MGQQGRVRDRLAGLTDRLAWIDTGIDGALDVRSGRAAGGVAEGVGRSGATAETIEDVIADLADAQEAVAPRRRDAGCMEEGRVADTRVHGARQGGRGDGAGPAGIIPPKIRITRIS